MSNEDDTEANETNEIVICKLCYSLFYVSRRRPQNEKCRRMLGRARFVPTPTRADATNVVQPFLFFTKFNYILSRSPLLSLAPSLRRLMEFRWHQIILKRQMLSKSLKSHVCFCTLHSMDLLLHFCLSCDQRLTEKNAIFSLLTFIRFHFDMRIHFHLILCAAIWSNSPERKKSQLRSCTSQNGNSDFSICLCENSSSTHSNANTLHAIECTLFES